MDGEWFLKWSPSVSSGETAELEYRIDTTVPSDISVEGIEDEKLTVQS